MLQLTAFDAGNGDALLVEVPESGGSWLALIDGGVGRTFQDRVAPYLESRDKGHSPNNPTGLDLVVCTHIDSDHITGLLALVETAQPTGTEAAWWPSTVWHNSFEDIVSHQSTHASRAQSLAAIASVPQGERLRRRLREKGIPLNAPDGQFIRAPRVYRSGSVHIDVLAPDDAAIEKLRSYWRKKGSKVRPLVQEVKPDDSQTNLASVVLHVSQGGHKLLLTGDQVASSIIEGLDAGGFGHLARPHHVDVMQIPHHGSRRNSSLALYKRVTARHYLVSASGKQEKPHPDVADQIAEARRGHSFDVWLTNEAPAFTEALIDRAAAHGSRVTIHHREPSQSTLTIAPG